MDVKVIRSLKKSLPRKGRGVIDATLTGGGEPLLSPHLPEIIRVLRDVPGIFFQLVTSGCLNEKDERFIILKEALKQADGKIRIFHSFNMFSPTFPERLAFTLPFVLENSAYKYLFIKMVAGLSFNKGVANYHFSEVRNLLEKTMEKTMGSFSKLIYFSAEEGDYSPKKITPLLKERQTKTFGYVLTVKAFLTPTVYFLRNPSLKNKRIVSQGQLVSMRGRARNILPPGKENARYSFGPGFICGAFNEELHLSVDGKILFCPYRKDFPPLYLGVAGESFRKISRRKKLLAYILNLQRCELEGTGPDPCDNCVHQAWQIFYGIK